jgi:sugar phosphate isomerase/epimerase
MPMPGLAVQLYTLRHLLDEDLERTLAALAATGVEAVETAGFHGRTGEGMRAALDAAGLAACSAHVPLDRIEASPDAVFEELGTLGAGVLVVPSVTPPITAAEADSVVERLGAAAEAGTAAGLRVAYHNHSFEFTVLDDGSELWHRLIAAGAPWALEPDAGWLQVAGLDPAPVLRALAGRCPLVHAKDVRPFGHEWRDVPVGEGVLDWAGIVAAAREAGTEQLVVEFDTPTEDTLRDIARSLDLLRGLLAS